MAKRKTKVTHFELETDEEDEKDFSVDEDMLSLSEPPLNALRRRRTTAYIMAQLPSNRNSIVKLVGGQSRDSLAQERQTQRRSLIRPDPHRESHRSSQALPMARKSVLYAGAARERPDIPTALPPSLQSIKVGRAGMLHHPQTEATAPMHAARAKAKPSVAVPLETLRQVAKELRIQQEREGDIVSLSESLSRPMFIPKDGRRSSSLRGKGQHQAAVEMRERLKSVAVPIAEKKAVRDRLATIDKSISATEALQKGSPMIGMFATMAKSLDIWSKHFKEIEGRFGSATASFFRFTRWLIVLNFFTFMVDFLVITVPFLAASQPPEFAFQKQDMAGGSPSGGVLSSNQSLDNQAANQSKLSASPYSFLEQAVNCSQTYHSTREESEALKKSTNRVLDVFLGTGWMETTTMFYGFYHNQTYESAGFTYNSGLAYIFAIGTTFLISFLLILTSSSQSVKQLVKDEHEQSTIHFTKSVLCGWDYSIFDYKSSNNRQNVLFQEFKADLLEQSKRLQRKNRTQRQKLVLVGVRVAVNTVALCIIAGSLFLIFYTTTFVLRTRQDLKKQSLRLVLQFLPSLTITILNAITPEVFNGLVRVEDYRPSFALKLTILRTVFVRLSSLGVLAISLYYTLLVSDSGSRFCAEEGKVDTRCCGNLLWPTPSDKHAPSARMATHVLCWETYVGQQFYRLAVVDFAALLAITFLVEFPRKFIYDTFKERSFLVKNFGQQEFDLPRNVLDIVYSQTLSWLGTFFAPLLPMMTLIKIVCVFYIKKWTLMKNYAPPQQVYKVSKSNSFFSFILLISLILVSVIIAYMIGSVNPSKSCGPFRVYSVKDFVVWTSITDLISSWPKWASTFLFFFGKSAFHVPCFAVLCLLMYYFWALAEGYNRIEEILREQLKLEEKEREFLLGRVNDMIQQGFTSTDTAGAKRDLIAMGSRPLQSTAPPRPASPVRDSREIA